MAVATSVSRSRRAKPCERRWRRAQVRELHILPQAGHDFSPTQFEESWPWVVGFLATHQMLSLHRVRPNSSAA